MLPSPTITWSPIWKGKKATPLVNFLNGGLITDFAPERVHQVGLQIEEREFNVHFLEWRQCLFSPEFNEGRWQPTLPQVELEQRSTYVDHHRFGLQWQFLKYRCNGFQGSPMTHCRPNRTLARSPLIIHSFCIIVFPGQDCFVLKLIARFFLQI